MRMDRTTKDWFARKLFEQFLLEKRKLRLTHSPQEEPDDPLIHFQYGDEIQALLENSKNQKEFIAGAKQVWSKFQSSQGRVRRGRPSEWRTVIAEIVLWYEDQKKDYMFEKTTDYQLIQHVKSKYPALHNDTIRKFVKLWRLTWTPPWNRSIADWRWLNKHEPGLVQDDFQAIKHLQESSTLRFALKDVEQRISAALKPR
jgi:hypothetical protein